MLHFRAIYQILYDTVYYMHIFIIATCVFNFHFVFFFIVCLHAIAGMAIVYVLTCIHFDVPVFADK